MGNGSGIPLAILLGCGMIAAAIYLGLTHRAEEVPPGASAPPAHPPLSVLGPRVRAQASAGLDAGRGAMAAACLGDAGTAALNFSLSFDASGREVLRGISQVGPGPDRVAQCLRERFPPSLQIPPPGTNISVEVPWTL